MRDFAILINLPGPGIQITYRMCFCTIFVRALVGCGSALFFVKCVLGCGLSILEMFLADLRLNFGLNSAFGIAWSCNYSSSYAFVICVILSYSFCCIFNLYLFFFKFLSNMGYLYFFVFLFFCFFMCCVFCFLVITYTCSDFFLCFSCRVYTARRLDILFCCLVWHM